jgi:ATP-dependent helicase HrpA
MAAANQRKGRCGRTSEGICIRLYSEEDFNSRTEYTEPEVLRTNLASVILQMKALKIGDIEQYPFINPPDRKFINDGMRLLREINALDKEERLTHDMQGYYWQHMILIVCTRY